MTSDYEIKEILENTRPKVRLPTRWFHVTYIDIYRYNSYIHILHGWLGQVTQLFAKEDEGAAHLGQGADLEYEEKVAQL